MRPRDKKGSSIAHSLLVQVILLPSIGLQRLARLFLLFLFYMLKHTVLKEIKVQHWLKTVKTGTLKKPPS